MDNTTDVPRKTSVTFANAKLDKLMDSVMRDSKRNSEFLEQSAYVLARHGIRFLWLSNFFTSSIIFLGAVAATSATFSALYGETSPWIIWFYAIIGVVIASVSGADAAFKLESRSTSRNLLAGEVTAKLYYFDAQINIIYIQAENYLKEKTIDDEKFIKIQDDFIDVLNHQVDYISALNQKAAELDVNLKWSTEKHFPKGES